MSGEHSKREVGMIQNTQFGLRTLIQQVGLQELKNSAQKIPDDVRKVLIVLHTAPFKECIIPNDEPSPFDAYEGSSQIGEVGKYNYNHKTST